MSHEVHIRRRETKSHLPAPVVANAKKILSSVYVGQGPLKGLEKDEEKKLVSAHLGMDPDEKDFPKILREFWANIRVEVPTDGVVLNVGKLKDDEPYNLYDYIIYQWIKKHPHVANDREEMLDNSRYQFYIYDPEVATTKENVKVSFKKKAYEQFILLGDDEDKIDRMVRLLTDSDPNNMSLKQKQNLLDDEIENDPERFFVIITDKHLQTKADIAEMVTYSIIRKIGNQYYFIDEKLGNDLDETVKYFNDKKNSSTITTLKAKLQEAKKNS